MSEVPELGEMEGEDSYNIEEVSSNLDGGGSLDLGATSSTSSFVRRNETIIFEPQELDTDENLGDFAAWTSGPNASQKSTAVESQLGALTLADGLDESRPRATDRHQAVVVPDLAAPETGGRYESVQVNNALAIENEALKIELRFERGKLTILQEQHDALQGELHNTKVELSWEEATHFVDREELARRHTAEREEQERRHLAQIQEQQLKHGTDMNEQQLRHSEEVNELKAKHLGEIKAKDIEIERLCQWNGRGGDAAGNEESSRPARATRGSSASKKARLSSPAQAEQSTSEGKASKGSYLNWTEFEPILLDMLQKATREDENIHSTKFATLIHQEMLDKIGSSSPPCEKIRHKINNLKRKYDVLVKEGTSGKRAHTDRVYDQLHSIFGSPKYINGWRQTKLMPRLDAAKDPYKKKKTALKNVKTNP